MTRLLPRTVLVLGISLVLAGVCRSAVVETTINYVGPKTVYLNAGSAAGVAKGDSAQVVRGNQIIALLEIVYVAQSSSSANLIHSDRDLRLGDKVRVMASGQGTLDSTTTTREPESMAEEVTPLPTTLSTLVPRVKSATRFHGRVSAQIIRQNDLEISSDNVTKPALSLRATVENLFVSHLNLSVNLRAREIIYPHGGLVDPSSDWDNRIYEVALQYDDPASALNYRLGRISSNRISGIGPFDGTMIDCRLKNGWSAGVFGGTRPDLAASSFSTRETTGGLYAALEKGDWTSHLVRGTIALVGRYHTGTIDEEFLYEQVQYNWSRRLLFSQSAEIAINRGWRQQAEGSSLGLSNVFFNASYTPHANFSFDVGYDSRKLMRTYETRNTPDSLFDEASRQGYRAGVSAKLPLGLRAWVRGGLSTRSTGQTDTRTLSTGLNRNDLFGSGISASVKWNTFENHLSSGSQGSLSLARYLFQVVYLQVEGGQSRYKFTSDNSTISYQWFNLDVSSYLSRHLYASSFGEIYRGDAMNTNRFGLELGYQF